jgi:hypothetical protein
MLYTSILAEIFKLKDGFNGPENRNVVGVADVVITKHNAPFVHIEYKSSINGPGFSSLLAQSKKYLYNHNLLNVDGMFGIYAKGN